jgi:hypothetical protein
MHVRVAHAAPVRLVPRGGRKERIGFRPCTTEAVIPEVQRADFEPLGFSIGATEFLLRDGRAWGAAPIHDDLLDGHRDAPSALAAWLGGEPVGRILAGVLGEVMRRSPIVPVSLDEPFRSGDETQHRPPSELPAHREIRADLSEHASSGVRDWLRDRLALVDGRVMMRFDPLATSKRDAYGIEYMDVQLHPNARSAPDAMFGLDRGAAIMRSLPKIARDRPRDYALFDTLARDRILPGHDRTWFLNAKAQVVHASLAEAARHRGSDRIEDLVRQVRPLADLSILGVLDEERHPGAVELLLAAAAEAKPLLTRGHPFHARLEAIAFLGGGALSPEPPSPPEDVASLGGLAR